MQTRPKDATHWTVRDVATKTGISKSSVHRYVTLFGVQPHPERCFFRHLRPDWTRQPDGDPVYGDGKSVFESALRYVEKRF